MKGFLYLNSARKYTCIYLQVSSMLVFFPKLTLRLLLAPHPADLIWSCSLCVALRYYIFLACTVTPMSRVLNLGIRRNRFPNSTAGPATSTIARSNEAGSNSL